LKLSNIAFWLLLTPLVIIGLWEIAAILAAHYPANECTVKGYSAEHACNYVRLGIDPFRPIVHWIEAHEGFFIAIGTLGLVGFTGTLWWSTNGLWRETANAAERTERNQIRLERPQIFSVVESVGLEENSAKLMITDQFQLAIANYGRTVAEITEIRVTYSVLPKGRDMPKPLDPSIRSGDGYRKPGVGSFAAVGEPFWEVKNWREALSQEYLLPESAVNLRVFFVGWVRYSDVFGNRYLLGFCRIFDPVGQHFVRTGDERYNYSRQE
jgi:hypothetical protein